MSVVEFIGFAISVLALLFLYFKNRADTIASQEHRGRAKEEDFLEGTHLKDFLKSIEKDIAEKEKPKPLPSSPPLPALPQIERKHKKASLSALEGRQLTSQLERRKIKSPIENRTIAASISRRYEEASPSGVVPLLHHAYAEEIHHAPARGKAAIQRLAHLQDLVIYQEIINKPKSLRQDQ